MLRSEYFCPKVWHLLNFSDMVQHIEICLSCWSFSPCRNFQHFQLRVKIQEEYIHALVAQRIFCSMRMISADADFDKFVQPLLASAVVTTSLFPNMVAIMVALAHSFMHSSGVYLLSYDMLLHLTIQTIKFVFNLSNLLWST